MSGSENTSANVRAFPKTTPGADSERPVDVARPIRDEAPLPGAHPAQPAAPVSADSAAKSVAKKPNPVRRIVLPVIIVAALAGGGWYGYDWWITGRFMVSTDDAYIQGDIASIAAKVSGYVDTINVVANQHVKAGDPLVTLNSGDYSIAFDQAQAQIDTENLTLKRFDAQITGAQASLLQAQAQKTALEAGARNASLAKDRADQLQAKSFGSQATLDSATATLDQANANLSGADAAIAAAQASIAVLQAQRSEAESSLKSLTLSRDKAQRDLGFTVLKAPYDGIVGNLAVQKGDLVSAGQRLAALVPVNALYIDANFKETQLAGMVPGETAHLHIDALGDDTIDGTVMSVSPASGSVFSLLPPENATGNFTKVVQRVPVRIALPQDALLSGRLRAGLSVVVNVDSRTAPAKTATAE